jgi:hypothetical protein
MAQTGDEDVDDLRWIEATCDLHEFIEQYETCLPAMIRVVDGYGGPDDQHCVSAGEASSERILAYYCSTINAACM